MLRNPHSESQAGYTLVEVIVSAIILGIVFVGTMQYFTLSRWQVERGMRSQLAWMNMASRLEKAVDLGYSSLQDSLPESSVSLVLNGIQGYRTTTVTPVDDTADGLWPTDTTTPDYVEVVVKFAWFTPDNITDSVSCMFSEERSWDY
jgi:prepilin-type N-terminal cleavage/methylation domain-containing protein